LGGGAFRSTAVSWQIVVGALIVVAIAVHFGEKAKERASRAKLRARLAAEPTHQLSFTREIRERWSADLQTMTLRVSRAEAGAALGAADSFTLERDAAGAWTITGSASAPVLPARIAEQLEARFQRLSGKTP
jgi:hypothetical protein